MVLRNILLVCAGRSSAVENRLTSLNCRITKAADGASALSLTRRHSFDAAVLISTGSEMDITETALNLRDVSSLMPIFVVVDRAAARRKDPSPVLVADLIPKTYALRAKDLSKYLAEPSLRPARTRGSSRTMVH
jgi:DNA-binding response OmpR family regulator